MKELAVTGNFIFTTKILLVHSRSAGSDVLLQESKGELSFRGFVHLDRIHVDVHDVLGHSLKEGKVNKKIPSEQVFVFIFFF